MGVAQGLKLKECLVLAQFEKYEERYALEINLCEILAQWKVKTVPATNLIKQGQSATILTTDSIKEILSKTKVQTICIVRIKGYDKKFKNTVQNIPFTEALERASLYNLYKDDISTVSLEFLFYRNEVCIFSDILKVGNIGDRDDVLKRIRKKLPKLIEKHWLF